MRRLLIAALAAGAPTMTQAQALAPMTDTVTVYGDRFALRLTAYNPYERPQRFALSVRDADGAPATQAKASVASLQLPAHETGAFWVWGSVPARGPIFVCVASPAFSTGRGSQITGEVCGKYHIVRLQP